MSSLFVIGSLLIAFTSNDVPWLIFPGLSLIGAGGITFLMTNMQISVYFPKLAPFCSCPKDFIKKPPPKKYAVSADVAEDKIAAVELKSGLNEESETQADVTEKEAFGAAFSQAHIYCMSSGCAFPTASVLFFFWNQTYKGLSTVIPLSITTTLCILMSVLTLVENPGVLIEKVTDESTWPPKQKGGGGGRQQPDTGQHSAQRVATPLRSRNEDSVIEDVTESGVQQSGAAEEVKLPGRSRYRDSTCLTQQCHLYTVMSPVRSNVTCTQQCHLYAARGNREQAQPPSNPCQ
ncbi:hypothetical protein Btru_073460 [Bulinus truncatus]|nr:hypothetical protein Btru_073460 [Bulinus truncatus]